MRIYLITDLKLLYNRLLNKRFLLYYNVNKRLSATRSITMYLIMICCQLESVLELTTQLLA